MIKRFFILLTAVQLLLTGSGIKVFSAGISGNITYQIEKSKDAVFSVDDKPAVDIEIAIPADCTDKFSMRLTVDYSIAETVPIYNSGDVQKLHYEFAVEDEGYHKLCAELMRNGGVYHRYEFEQYYIKSVRNDTYTQRGFCVHYEQSKGTLNDAEMIKASGTSVVRDGISWSGVEKEKGVYDFSKSDEFIPLLTSYGVEVLCVVDSYKTGHDLYLDENGNRLIRSPEQIEAFTEFVLAAVKRYPQIRKWEILNEPNFVLTGQEYFNIVYAAAKKIKAYDPTLEVYAGGLAIYDNKNFVNGFYVEKLYPYVDGISYHHYNHWRYADGPEYYSTTDEIKDIMLREGGWKNLIITETGYSTGIYDQQVPEIKQASDNVKRAVICDWYGIDFLTYYDFKNDGYDETEREHNFGTVEIDNTPKPGYYTIKQYQKASNRAQYIGQAYLSDDITAHVYAANDNYFMIAWAKNPDAELDIRKDNPVTAEYTFSGNVRIEDMFGNYVSGNTLTATYQPSYIFGLSGGFCLEAVSEYKNDIFANLKDIAAETGYSVQEIENAYNLILTEKNYESVKNYINVCYDTAEDIVNDYLYGALDISEAAFSDFLSEIELASEAGARLAALLDESGAAPADVMKNYDAVSAAPADAVQKGVAYINEPYYKGKYILNKISKYDEEIRVEPQHGNGFELKSDNTMIFSGTASAEEAVIRIDDAGGNTVYVNTVPTDGSGNYDFSLVPDFPYGEYTVEINNGEVMNSVFGYNQAEDYLSVEDKMTSVSLLQADRLLKLYTGMLDWADIKYNYYHPEVEALVWNETQWINVTGEIARLAWAEYSDVIMSVYNSSGELVYIDSTFPNEDGSYRFSFKYEGSSDGLTVKINQGGVAVDDKTIELAAENRLITGTLKLTGQTDTTDVMLQIQNYFKLTGRTVQVAVAYYDAGGKMLSCALSDSEIIDRDENLKRYSFEKQENAALLKVFAWDSADKMNPQTESIEAETV